MPTALVRINHPEPGTILANLHMRPSVFKGHAAGDIRVADLRRHRGMPVGRAVLDLVGHETSRRIELPAAGGTSGLDDR